MGRAASICVCALVVAASYSGGPVLAQAPGAPKTAAEWKAEAARRKAAERTRLIDEAKAKDAELVRLVGERKPVIQLPDRVRGTWIDPEGRPWFYTDRLDADASGLRESIQGAYAGTTRVIHGGRPVLRDGGGRLWVIAFNNAGNTLLGYDGKAWVERKAVGTDSPKEYDWGRFTEQAFEGRDGSVWFIGRHSTHGVGIHRYRPDGTWDYQHVATGAQVREDAYAFLEEAMVFVRQQGGRMVLAARRVNGRPGRTRVLYFDSTRWSVIDPRVCREDHEVRGLVPFPDGSIGTICEESRLWTYWPETAPVDDKRVTALVVKLDAADAAERDRAASELVSIGPRLRDRLREALEDQPGPETALRIRAVLQSFAALDADAKRHGHGVLHAGRYTFDQCYLAGRSATGRVVLYVERLLDWAARKEHDRALVVVSADGQWTVRPIPEEQWVRAGWSKIPSGCYEDAKGRIYLPGNALRVNAKTELEAVNNLGVSIGQIDGEDADGRLYSGRYILDEGAGAAKPALAVAQYRVHSICGMRGDGSLVGQFVDGSAKPFWQFNGGTWRAVGGMEVEGNLVGWLPLSGGAGVLQYGSFERPPVAVFFDGKTVRRDSSLMGLLQKDPAPFRKLAGRSFGAIDRQRLAADDQGRLWYSRADYDHDAQGGQRWVNRLLFNDGKQWHDAWQETGIAPPPNDTCVGAADGARTVLIRGGMQRGQFTGVTRMWFEGGRVRAKALELPDGFQLAADRTVWAPDGGVWLTSKAHPGRMFRYANGKVTEAAQKGVPLLVDRAGRLWFRGAGRALCALDEGGGLAAGEIDGLVDVPPLVETRDGRVLLLTNEAMLRVEVEAVGGKSVVRAVQRWAWGAPRNRFDWRFVDADNGLWLQAGPSLYDRFTLPAAAAAAK